MIPLFIGKNSSGENQLIDLSQIGLLMISYSEEEQFLKLFKDILTVTNTYNYIITNTRSFRDLKIDTNNSNLFLKD